MIDYYAWTQEAEQLRSLEPAELAEVYRALQEEYTRLDEMQRGSNFSDDYLHIDFMMRQASDIVISRFVDLFAPADVLEAEEEEEPQEAAGPRGQASRKESAAPRKIFGGRNIIKAGRPLQGFRRKAPQAAGSRR